MSGPWLARARQVATLAGDGYRAMTGRGVAFTHQPLGHRIDPEGLQGYWCDLRHKARWARETSSDGFPRFEDGAPIEYPIAVAQTALGFWELRLDGEPADEPFLTIADWLVERAEPRGVGVVWLSNLPQAKYGLAEGWASAMGQGQAISVLLRAHLLTGDARYLRTARAGFEPMAVPVDEGGVQRELDGALVLEEYPSPYGPTAVLNGWIFALLGLHELHTATGDERVGALLGTSVDGLLALLPRYDVGWWSLYSLLDHGRPDLAKPFYHRLHPVMLDALALVRPDPRLTATARRWEAQVTPLHLARNAVDKMAFRAYRAWTDRSR